jgi:catechol 2,3-dioxygenase-like lactoylglutathione lyase family enzyme
MARVQLALNVSDLGEAVRFYSKLFSTQPAKLRPGYANFAVDEPPLKLVLIEDSTKEPGTLNHLGVEVEGREQVADAAERLQRQGLSTALEDEVTCCYAVQDKVWVNGPGGELWEIYTVLADAEAAQAGVCSTEPEAPACCATRPDLAPSTSTSTPS